MGFAGSSKLTLSAMVLSLLGASVARAQTAFAVKVGVSVGGAMSLETTAIDFGRITPGQTQVVLPQANVAQGTAGRVLLTYNTDALSISLPAEMVLSGPGAEIHASLRCAAIASREVPQGAPFSCGDGYQFVAAGDRSSSPMVFVGGVVPGNETLGKPAGVYTGAVVVTAQITST